MLLRECVPPRGGRLLFTPAAVCCCVLALLFCRSVLCMGCAASSVRAAVLGLLLLGALLLLAPAVAAACPTANVLCLPSCASKGSSQLRPAATSLLAGLLPPAAAASLLAGLLPAAAVDGLLPAAAAAGPATSLGCACCVVCLVPGRSNTSSCMLHSSSCCCSSSSCCCCIKLALCFGLLLLRLWVGAGALRLDGCSIAVGCSCCCAVAEAVAEAGPRLPVASSSESLVGKSKLWRTDLSGFSAGEQAEMLREGLLPGRKEAAGTVLSAGAGRCCPVIDLLKVRAAGFGCCCAWCWSSCWGSCSEGAAGGMCALVAAAAVVLRPAPPAASAGTLLLRGLSAKRTGAELSSFSLGMFSQSRPSNRLEGSSATCVSIHKDRCETHCCFEGPVLWE